MGSLVALSGTNPIRSAKVKVGLTFDWGLCPSVVCCVLMWRRRMRSSAVPVVVVVGAVILLSAVAMVYGQGDIDSSPDASAFVESEAEMELDAEFPVSNRFDQLSANCMSVSHAVCLGNSSRTDGRGTFAIARPAKPFGLVGHWTFDDLIAQDHTGHMVCRAAAATAVVVVVVVVVVAVDDTRRV